MKYKEFLMEVMSKTERTKAITLPEAVDIFLKHCKKYNLDKDPFIRGVKTKEDFSLVQGNITPRKALGGYNHANIIVDKNIDDVNKSYPKRQFSTIFTTYKGIHHANRFGEPHVIIPFDDCKFSYCEIDDFNDLVIDGDDPSFISMVLALFSVDDDSFDTIVNQSYQRYQKMISDGAEINDDDFMYNLMNGCKDKADAANRIKNLLSLKKCKIKFTDDLYDIYDTNYEIWTDGKCLLVDYKKYKSFKDEVNKRK